MYADVSQIAFSRDADVRGFLADRFHGMRMYADFSLIAFSRDADHRGSAR
jgi:hypothetical protein